MPLISILLAVIGGQSISAVLAGVSIMQWIEIASTVASAEPTIVKLLAELHPAFAILAQNIKNGASPEQAGTAAQQSLGPHYHGGPKSNF